MNRLIWTYKTRPGNNTYYLSIDSNTKEIVLINFYILSITSAKKLGYHTVIYCDKQSENFFLNIVDEIHIIERYPTLCWDCFKMDVLENEDGEFCLIDGDLILYKRLPKFENDIVFDAYEYNNYVKTYEHTTNQLTELGVTEIVPEWFLKDMPTINCGILYIKNNWFKKLYVQRWRDYDKFIIKNENKIDDKFVATCVCQYILEVMGIYYNQSMHPISDAYTKMGEHYKHYSSALKFWDPIVPTTYIINPNEKKSLF